MCWKAPSTGSTAISEICNAPAAVIDLEFFLTSDLPAKPGILMQKRYVKSVPVSGRSPEALVKSWDLALEEILTALTADLRAVK